METNKHLPKDYCKMEAIKYIASRYGTTPEEVLEHYFMQTGVEGLQHKGCLDYELETNELALLHDLRIKPMAVENK